MDLSIAMIVKNEEKNLKKCLKATEYLKGKISYEIIIVDTGSTDKTIDIAKKYTDRVYNHPWTGDFSEMRNISIKYSKGEWILILDADEVLDNPQELVDFVKSSDSKKYNAAEINFKNLLSDDVNNYILASLYRLFRNLKEFYYVGRIHEQPRVIVPFIKSRVTVLHYGYSREDYEVMRYKYERNKELLLKDLKNNIEPIYTRFQLAQTYSMANFHNEAFETIKEAYELDRKRKDGKRNVNVYHFYSRELFSRGQYTQAIKVCNQVLDYYNDSVDFYYILANSYLKLNEYDKALEEFKKYFELHDKKAKGSAENSLPDGGAIVDYSFARKAEMVKNYLICLYDNKNYSQLIDEYEKISDEKEKKELEQLYLFALVFQNKTDKIIKHYNNEISDMDIENIINVIAKVCIDNTEFSYKKLSKKFLGIDKKLDLYINEIYFSKEIVFDYKDFNFSDYYTWKAVLLRKVLFNNQYILEALKDLKADILQNYINIIISNYDCLKLLYDYSERKFMTKEIKELLFVNIIEKALLFNSSIDNKKFNALVKRVRFNMGTLIDFKYNTEIINNEEMFFVLDRYEELWARINYLIKFKRSDIVAYIKGFKETLESMLEYKKILDIFIKEFKTDIITEQMIEEKNNLLVVVEQMIAENKTEEGLEILNQLNQMFIYDKDILLYRGVVLYLLKSNQESIIDLAEAYILTDKSFDAVYNVACVLEADGKMQIAKQYFKEAYEKCKDNQLKSEIERIIGE